MKSFRKKWNNFPFKITNQRRDGGGGGGNVETMEKKLGKMNCCIHSQDMEWESKNSPLLIVASIK